MPITPEEFSLVEKRLEQWNEKFKVGILQLGTFTKDEMLKHMKAKDEVGQELARIQLFYLRTMKERRR